ncbi:FAD-dependent oxidoreductase [Candidatus Bathyarchaeota archaeon]|nr:FAD-dependent oxidoreductase [Candidatus Bathyarchaeota archaeon]
MVKLAVIGAGIGGCSAAYFANKHLPDSKITIYEMKDRTGGRVLTHHEEKLNFEIGATFLSLTNKTILNLINDLRLKVKKIAESTDFAVWNGSEIIFKSNQHMALTILKHMLRYKLSATRIFSILKEAKQQISNLYEEEEQNPNEINELFKSTGLNIWHNKPFSRLLVERGVDEAFTENVITPITRIIYSQNANIGGFAGLSSLLGVYEGSIYSLEEGNSVLPRRLAEASNSELELGQKVKTIEKTSEGSYRISTEKETRVFDAVIVAAPLELAGLEFDSVSIHEREPQQYKKVYRKVMRGLVNPRYFGLAESTKLPSMILTTAEAEPITHFAIQKSVNGESFLSVSSTEPLYDDELGGILMNGKTVLEHDWEAAYPVFKPLEKLPRTRLDERLMYINTIEPAASSMEASAFAALNATKIILSELG